MKFKNNFDGLWGLNYKEKKYDIIIEYLNTTHQSGNFHGKNGIGVDSYYWHDQYVQGWTVEGQLIGNHVLSPDNNRIEMFLFGLSILTQLRFEKLSNILPLILLLVFC